MTATTADIDARAAGLGLFEKWLSVWVGAAILAGIALGNITPELFASLAAIEYASVNLVVAVLLIVRCSKKARRPVAMRSRKRAGSPIPMASSGKPS